VGADAERMQQARPTSAEPAIERRRASVDGRTLLRGYAPYHARRPGAAGGYAWCAAHS